MKAIEFLILLTALLPGTHLAAQTPASGDDAEPVNYYQVEVLVFRNLDQARTTSEIARLVEPEIDDVLDEQLARLAAGQSTADKTGNETEADAPVFWQIAEPGQRFMRADAARLRKLQAYKVVDYLAWVQPVEDVASATAIDVENLTTNQRLSGTFKLYRKRYIHLAVDLTLESTERSKTGGSTLSQFLPINRVPPKIVDSRRMRFGRTVYFDQPEFGVLATVYKLEQSAADKPDPAHQIPERKKAVSAR